MERSCNSVSLPPRINWKTWLINSTSRIPPKPSLMLFSKLLRRTSRLIIAFMARRASMALKSKYLRYTKGRSSFSKLSPACLSPAMTLALIMA